MKQKEERKGEIKKKTIEKAKENSDIVDFVKSVTREEMQRLKQMRAFATIEQGTPTYKIAVLCDTLRQQMRQIKMTISKRLWSMDDLTNNIRRLEIQLTSKLFTETMKNGIVMNESEVNSLKKHNGWLREGEFESLYTLLGEMRAIVDQPDVAGNVIMQEEDFEVYVAGIEKYVAAYGYNLYGELK